MISLLLILSPSTECVIIDNGNSESRRMIVCDHTTDNEQRSEMISFQSLTGYDYTFSFFSKEKTSWKKACVKPKFLATLSIL